jgi:Ca-activated chloride channel family protein
MNRPRRFISVLILLLCFLFPGGTHSQNKYVLAVIDFNNSTGESRNDYLREAIPEILATNLAQSDKITVLERDRVKKILKESGLIMSGVTEGDLTKIGKLLSAKQLVSGSIIKIGTQFRIDVRITDTGSGKIIAAENRRCRTADEIIDAVDILSVRLVKAVTGKSIILAESKPGSESDIIRGNYIDLEVMQQNRYYSSIERSFYIRAGFLAREVRRKRKRVPLNISVVLDRSGSMGQEDKLTYAKKAITFIIKNLGKKDIISLVTYDDRVKVAIPPVKGTEKRRLITLVNEITTGGSTNLSGGLMEGYNQVKTHYSSSRINRVLLISDGLANVGIKNPRKIEKIVQTKSRDNITVSSFGVGKYFNEKLLTGIAEYGNANYYYIDESDKIPEIFSSELAGLLAVAAQNSHIAIKGVNGAVVKRVYGYKYKTEENITEIRMGDIVSEEKKILLAEIVLPGVRRKNLKIAEVTFSYDDSISDFKRIVKKADIMVSYTANSNLIAAHTNPSVIRDREMFLSSELMEKTMDMVDKGNVEGARKMIDKNLNRVKSVINRYQSRDMKKQALNIIEYRTKLDRYRSAPSGAAGSSDSFYKMQKSSRSKQYMLRKKK